MCVSLSVRGVLDIQVLRTRTAVGGEKVCAGGGVLWRMIVVPCSNKLGSGELSSKNRNVRVFLVEVEFSQSSLVFSIATVRGRDVLLGKS